MLDTGGRMWYNTLSENSRVRSPKLYYTINGFEMQAKNELFFGGGGNYGRD